MIIIFLLTCHKKHSVVAERGKKPSTTREHLAKLLQYQEIRIQGKKGFEEVKVQKPKKR